MYKGSIEKRIKSFYKEYDNSLIGYWYESAEYKLKFLCRCNI